MTSEEALAACEATVRRHDPDRYLASLFAPAGKRPLLFALYAFNHEIARATEVTHEPMMAEIRLQWWREAVEEARTGRARAHPVAIALAQLSERAAVSQAALGALIDARAVEISSAPFPDLAALERHADATAGALMRLAAALLGPDEDLAELTRDAGTAYGLAGILRSFSFHAARGKVFLSADLLGSQGLTMTDALAGEKPAAVKRAMRPVMQSARMHFQRARAANIPRHTLPAVLPASLVPAFLSRMERTADPLRERQEISRLRRQLVLLRASMLGRL